MKKIVRERKFLSLDRGGRIVNRLSHLLVMVGVIGIVIFNVPSAGAADTPPRPMKVDDYFRFRDVGDPQISPDGKWVGRCGSYDCQGQECMAAALEPRRLLSGVFVSGQGRQDPGLDLVPQGW